MPINADNLRKARERTELQAMTAVKKECQACHEDFETLRRWEKRCEHCREIDAPYTKRVYNDNAAPF